MRCARCGDTTPVPDEQYAELKAKVVADSYVTEIGDLFEDLKPTPQGQPVIKPQTVYYLRVGAGPFPPQRPSNGKDGYILRLLAEAGSFVIVSGVPAMIDELRQLDEFGRKEPARLELPTLSHADLANITAQKIMEAGYRLQRSDVETTGASAATKASTTIANGGGGGSGECDDDTWTQVGKVNLAVMEHICRERYDDAMIAMRNAHLAKDMLQQANAAQIPGMA